MKRIGIGSTGRMASAKWEGGVVNLNTPRDGFRSGKTRDADDEPVGGILVGGLYVPTRKIVGHTRSDENGDYYFGGLRPNSDDYVMFAYADEEKLGGKYEFPTRYKLTEYDE